jgi:tRNA G18 (ribose-2'-O)-methylase SpoU
MIKLGASDLRTTVPDPKDLKQIKKNPVYIIIDNVLDTYNIGAIFRLSDAVAASKVLICGASETPPHTRIKKASINTTEWVEWEYFRSAKDAIEFLRKDVPDIKVYSVELDKRSVPYDSVEYTFPVALVVGHESNGVSEEAMRASDGIVEIPMWGVNKSMNVMVSLGIVLFEVMKHYREQS